MKNDSNRLDVYVKISLQKVYSLKSKELKFLRMFYVFKRGRIGKDQKRDLDFRNKGSVVAAPLVNAGFHGDQYILQT